MQFHYVVSVVGRIFFFIFLHLPSANFLYPRLCMELFKQATSTCVNRVCMCVCVCWAAVRIYATTLIMPSIHSLIRFLIIYFPISLSPSLGSCSEDSKKKKFVPLFATDFNVCRINGATCDEKWITRGYENCRL